MADRELVLMLSLPSLLRLRHYLAAEQARVYNLRRETKETLLMRITADSLIQQVDSVIDDLGEIAFRRHGP